MRKQAKKQLCESMEYLIHTAETIGDLLGRLSREQATDILAQIGRASCRERGSAVV